jgi:hypothetical protein
MRELIVVCALAACGDDSSKATDDAQPPDAITLSILDAYGKAWGEPNADARRRLLEYAAVETLTVDEPTRSLASRDEVYAAMGQFQVDVPGGSVVAVGNIRESHDRVWLNWDTKNGSGTSVAVGTDLMKRSTADMRIERVHSFFGTLPLMLGANTPVQQALIDAWNQPDNAMRATLLATALADNVVVSMEFQQSVFTGRVAFSALIGNELTAAPTRIYSVTSGYLTMPNAFYVAWKTADGATTMQSGVMMAILAGDGRISEAVYWTGAVP